VRASPGHSSRRARERQLSLNATFRELLEGGLAASAEERSRTALTALLAPRPQVGAPEHTE
jgi:hypothetical protein